MMTTHSLSTEPPEKMETGQLIPGKGVYLGLWTPRDSEGNSLKKTFNVFVSPTDIIMGDDSRLSTFVHIKSLTGLLSHYVHASGRIKMKFNSAVEFVAGLRNYHGHDGGHFTNEKNILDAAQRNPAALEKWFIPPMELMNGATGIQPANLYNSRCTGAFRDTFVNWIYERGAYKVNYYWTSSRNPKNPSRVYTICFSSGDGESVFLPGGQIFGTSVNEFELSTRVVRAELRNG
jgi:hypothetical protein